MLLIHYNAMPTKKAHHSHRSKIEQKNRTLLEYGKSFIEQTLALVYSLT